MHLRGPMNVSKLAVYALTNTAFAGTPLEDGEELGRRKEALRTKHTIVLPTADHHAADNKGGGFTLPVNHTGRPTPSTLTTLAQRQNSTPKPNPRVKVAAAGWNRIASYTSAAPAQATGFAFLGNKGDPQKSGTFD